MKYQKSFALLTLALIVTVAPIAASASDLWLHVKVEEANDNANVMVNLPLSLVEKALSMIPTEEFRAENIQIDGQEFTADDLREFWQAVQDTPDMNFVTVQSKNETVRVSKAGEHLLVRTTESGPKGAKVDIKLPLAVVDALLEGTENGELNFAAALQALAAQGEGELATISADDTNVRVWIDNNPES